MNLKSTSTKSIIFYTEKVRSINHLSISWSWPCYNDNRSKF